MKKAKRETAMVRAVSRGYLRHERDLRLPGHFHGGFRFFFSPPPVAPFLRPRKGRALRHRRRHPFLFLFGIVRDALSTSASAATAAISAIAS